MTMNEADVDTRHSYNRYMLETLQIEYERSQEMRDIVQAQNVCDEHTSPNATQVAADDMMTNDGGGVKCSRWSGLTQADMIDIADCVDDDHQDMWDETWDDLMSAEELERAQREEDERRADA